MQLRRERTLSQQKNFWKSLESQKFSRHPEKSLQFQKSLSLRKFAPFLQIFKVLENFHEFQRLELGILIEGLKLTKIEILKIGNSRQSMKFFFFFIFANILSFQELVTFPEKCQISKGPGNSPIFADFGRPGVIKQICDPYNSGGFLWNSTILIIDFCRSLYSCRFSSELFRKTLFLKQLCPSFWGFRTGPPSHLEKFPEICNSKVLGSGI